MSSQLPSFRRQHLNIEFASLRVAKLEGVFLSITPGDPTLWVGVMFVRRGKSVLMWFQSPISHYGVFTLDRSICSCGTTFPDFIPSQLPRPAASRDLLNRCLPPTTHTFDDVHVHNCIT